MPDTPQDNKTVTLPKPETAKPSLSDPGDAKPDTPATPSTQPKVVTSPPVENRTPSTPAKPQANTPTFSKPPQTQPDTPAQHDTRPVAAAPEAGTTQKPNQTPAVFKPTGGVFIGGPAKAAVPESKHADLPEEQPKGPAWNHRGVVTTDNADEFVYVDRVPGNLPFRGVCLKCGWQSIQVSNQAAIDAVHRHLGRHIREAVA